MTDEEYVRAHFPDSHELEGRYGTSLVWLDKDAEFGDWAAAAEFTRERLEQIRQLEAEIDSINHYPTAACLLNWMNTKALDIPFGIVCGYIVRYVRCNRTISRLESALADLRKGMTA